jgi:hypothetical protein
VPEVEQSFLDTVEQLMLPFHAEKKLVDLSGDSPHSFLARLGRGIGFCHRTNWLWRAADQAAQNSPPDSYAVLASDREPEKRTRKTAKRAALGS